MKVSSILSVARAAGVLCIFAGLAIPSAFAEKDPSAIIVAPAKGGEPSPGGHVTKDLSGVVETGENLTLRLNTDLGSVHVISLERGAAPLVRY